MRSNGKKRLFWLVLLAMCSGSAQAADNPALRAYPDPLPEDVSFDVVVKSQPFPFMKYPVPIVGLKTHPEEVHVTPSGQLLFPASFNTKLPCVTFLVGSRPAGQGDAKDVALSLLPADGVKSQLVDGCLPAVENRWTVGNLQVEQLAFASEGGRFESLTGQEPLFALSRITVKNASAAAQDVVLAIQFGEATPGMSVKAVPPPNPRKLVFEAPFIRQEDGAYLGCLLTKDLKTSFASDAAPAVADRNRLRIEFALPAGESKTVDLAVPYFPLPKQAGQQLAALRIDDELSGFRKFWARELDRNAQFILPEKRIRDAYRVCVANNLMLIDRDPKSGTLMPHPDPYAYEAVWAGDGSVSMQAMDRMGYHKEVERMLDYFLARQGKDKPEGDVSSADGFFSGDVGLKWMNQNGFVLWAMSEHFKLTHDEPWLRRVAGQLVKGCDWIIRERARTKVMENGKKPRHYGLMPKGRPSDLDTVDYWYWTDTYSYMGLRGTADVLAEIGMTDEARRLAAEADDYKACILDSIERSIDPKVKPPFVPPTPYLVGPPSVDFFNKTWYSLCSPIYMVEAGLLDPRGEKASGINYWLEKYGLYSGMPQFQTRTIDACYVYNQSLSQLLRGEPAKFDWTLYSITAYAMGPGTYCTLECHDLVGGSNGEAWNANQQPHIHSNSRYIDLVRIALLLEEGNTLHLLSGAPRGWLADGQTIEIKHAPSYFGEVNFTARSQVASGQITFDLQPLKWHAPKVVLHVRPPAKYGPIKSVRVNGQEWKDFDSQSVRLPGVKKETKVICVF
jgi:hypothetical protein